MFFTFRNLIYNFQSIYHHPFHTIKVHSTSKWDRSIYQITPRVRYRQASHEIKPILQTDLSTQISLMQLSSLISCSCFLVSPQYWQRENTSIPVFKILCTLLSQCIQNALITLASLKRLNWLLRRHVCFEVLLTGWSTELHLQTLQKIHSRLLVTGNLPKH